MHMQQCTCNNAHATMHMQQCTCNNAHAIHMQCTCNVLAIFGELSISESNKVGRPLVWFIVYAAVYDYTGVCVPTSILVNFFPNLLGLINRTPSWLQPQFGQISIEPHPKTHFEK